MHVAAIAFTIDIISKRRQTCCCQKSTAKQCERVPSTRPDVCKVSSSEATPVATGCRAESGRVELRDREACMRVGLAHLLAPTNDKVVFLCGTTIYSGRLAQGLLTSEETESGEADRGAMVRHGGSYYPSPSRCKSEALTIR